MSDALAHAPRPLVDLVDPVSRSCPRAEPDRRLLGVDVDVSDLIRHVVGEVCPSAASPDVFVMMCLCLSR